MEMIHTPPICTPALKLTLPSVLIILKQGCGHTSMKEFTFINAHSSVTSTEF